MSIGKVLGGTIVATPAVGGGGYVIYKEVTKEEITTQSPTEQTANLPGSNVNVPSSDVRDELPRTESEDRTQVQPPAAEASSGVAAAPQVRESSDSAIPGPNTTEQEAGVTQNTGDTGQNLAATGTNIPGSSGGDGASA